MNRIRLTILMFVVVLLLGSQCVKTKPGTENIALEFQPLVDSFIREASRRDVKVRTENGGLLVRYGRMEGKHGGSCMPSTHPKVITIDSVKWRYIDSVEKEVLLFHELAHCLLMRPHNNDVFQFGECKSLLREDVEGCTLDWRNDQWREYYLDELFAPSEAGNPSWYTDKTESTDLSDLPILQRIKLEGSKFHYLDSFCVTGSRNWILHITGSIPAPNSHVGFRINEIALETGFMKSERLREKVTYTSLLVIMNTNPRKILREVTLNGDAMELSIQKSGSAIYIFFGGVLQYVLPISPTALTIGAYSSFPQDHYNAQLYADVIPM